MLDGQSDSPRLEMAIENLIDEMARQGKSAHEISVAINPSSPNKVGGFIKARNGNLRTFLAIEEVLGLPPGGLLQRSPQASAEDIEALLDEVVNQTVRLDMKNGPSIEDVIRFYHECGGEISPQSPLLEHIDMYEMPDENGIKVNPVRIGSASLMSKHIGARSAEEVKAILSEANSKFTAASAQAHKRVFDGETIMDMREIDEVFCDGTVLTARFARLLERGTWAGRPVVLTFAKSV